MATVTSNLDAAIQKTLTQSASLQAAVLRTLAITASCDAMVAQKWMTEAELGEFIRLRYRRVVPHGLGM
jgi:hypothetical protein